MEDDRSTAAGRGDWAIQHATGENVSPWLPRHTKLLERFIENFGEYAKVRRSASANDLVFWAILCGAFELAEVLWSQCESPLRTLSAAEHDNLIKYSD